MSAHTRPSGIPLRAELPRASIYLQRAAFAAARFACDPRGITVEQVAETLWRDDSVTPLILRSASSPATTTGAGWAAGLARNAVGDFIASLMPISAGAKLLDAAVRINLDGINQISFPARSGAIDPAAVPWVAQGAPIPVGQFSLVGATLGPTHKLAILAALTRECAEHGSGETVLTTLLKENAALALDASLFSTTAATADRPAGLLNGVAALTATAGGGDAAMTADLANLASAVGAHTAGLAFVMHPAQAAAVKLRRGTAFPADIPIWSTIAIAAGTVIALDPRALATGYGGEPEVTASQETVLHMEDTAPLPIGTPGTPTSVAAPARSMFQTDCIAIRLILRATWAWRAAGCVAWISGATW